MKAMHMTEMPDMKPTLRLSDKELPELKDWEVGKQYKLTLLVEQVELSKPEVVVNEKDNKYSGTFKVLKVTSNGKSDEEPEEEDEEEEKPKPYFEKPNAKQPPSTVTKDEKTAFMNKLTK